MIEIMGECVTMSASLREMRERFGRTITIDMLSGLFRRHRECCGVSTRLESYLDGGRGAVRDTVRPPVFEDETPTIERESVFSMLAPQRKTLRKGVLFPDAHVPDHHEESWDLALEVCRVLQPDFIVILGDFLDFASVSKHKPLPGEVRRTVEEELVVAERCLDDLDALGATEKLFSGGNHDFRLDRYIAQDATPLSGFRGLSLQERLSFKDRGWRYTRYNDFTSIGDLTITHDVGKAGVYAARQSRMAIGGSIAIGHCHRMSMEFENTCDGRQHHVGAAFGWLGDADKIRYRNKALARKEWVHGVGIAYIDDLNHTHLVPCPFVNGRAVVDGQIVSLPSKLAA